MAEIDHIVIGARTLDEGAAYVEAHLGARPQPGGRHDGIGTHNLVMPRPRFYLEVIAADPDQPTPPQGRPFDLDDPSVKLMLEAGPHLIGWVARTPALEAWGAAVVRRWRGRCGPGAGTPCPGDGHAAATAGHAEPHPLPIQWDDGQGAAPRLADSGCRLVALEAEHHDVDALRQALAARGLEEALKVRRSPHPRLVARMMRADGTEVALASG